MNNQESTIYIENGFPTRQDYLESLSEEYDIPFDTVMALAQMLGESEDFDGLISELEAEQYRIETDFGYGE